MTTNELAEKICYLSTYGQELHPNDIIPYIKSFLSTERHTLRAKIIELKRLNPYVSPNLTARGSMGMGAYSTALDSVLALIDEKK